MGTMNNGNYSEPAEYEEGTIKLNHPSKYLNKQRVNSNSSSFIRTKTYPRLPPKCKTQIEESNNNSKKIFKVTHSDL